MYSTAGDPGEKRGWIQGRADFMIALIAMARGSSYLRTIFYGAILGILLFILFGSLNYGMQTTFVSNAGFLFSTTVVLVLTGVLLTSVFSKTAKKKRVREEQP